MNPRGWLDIAPLYSLVQNLLGATAVRRRFLVEYVRPNPGERILDLGCGPGDVVAWLPPMDYLGLDLNPRYVRAARRRYGSRGRFRQADVRSLAADDLGRFDVIIAIGVLHHLSDPEAAQMIAAAAGLLAPGGRLVTLDPGRSPETPRTACWLLARDRGDTIRSPDGYRALAHPAFHLVESHVHHDLARVPYTHVVLVCRQPVSAP
jgi:SAM-dependent methyltransferase